MRLTRRNGYGRAMIGGDMSPTERAMMLPEILDRLAAYEDTGLEPEEIKLNMDGLDEYHKAEAEGRLVILPCKVGTPVWSSVLCRIDENAEEHPAQWPFMISMMDEWGTGFFLTREEAESVLKGERKADGC